VSKVLRIRSHEGELDVASVGRVPGCDDPPGGVERDVLAEFTSAVEVGGEGAAAGEPRVESAVCVLAGERHVEDRRAGRAADDDDPPGCVDDQVLGKVVAATDIGRDRAKGAESLVEGTVGAVAQ
jgi:hypothetical protein